MNLQWEAWAAALDWQEEAVGSAKPAGRGTANVDAGALPASGAKVRRLLAAVSADRDGAKPQAE